MYRDDRLRPRADGRLQTCWIERERRWIDVDEDGRGSSKLDGGNGRHRRVADRDDFIAWSYGAGPKREMEGLGSAPDADAVGNANVSGELVLERSDLRTEDVAAGLEDAPDRGVDLLAMRDVAGARVRARDQDRIPTLGT